MLTDKAVGVLTVQLVTIVQVQGEGQRLLWGGGPLQDLLGPVHPQEAMHLPFTDHLILMWTEKAHLLKLSAFSHASVLYGTLLIHLSSVPETVVRRCLLQLLKRVDIRPFVFGVIFQGLLSPLVCAWEPREDTRVVKHQRMESSRRRSALTLHAVVLLVVEAEVVRQLPAHHQLLDEGGDRCSRLLPAALDLQRHLLS